MVYVAGIIELERKRLVRPGGLVVASLRQIAETSGVSLRRVKELLERMAEHGIILVKYGEPRKWEGKATEIRRVIPIPSCPETGQMPTR